METTRHLSITGRVQGVGFRQFMARTARDLQVTGWVRNRADGSVEAIVAGRSDAVDRLIEQARRGPPQALVTDVRITETQGAFESFGMLPTV